MNINTSNVSRKYLKGLFASPLIFALSACSSNTHKDINEKPKQAEYMPPHETICYKHQDTEVKCGDFSLINSIITHHYHEGIGEDVMASFSVATHPGDYPYLKKQATKLGYLGGDSNPALEKPIVEWRELGAEEKASIIKSLRGKVTAQNANFSFKTHFKQCLNYWSDTKAEFNQNLEPVKIAEVAALCVAQSGILPKVR